MKVGRMEIANYPYGNVPEFVPAFTLNLPCRKCSEREQAQLTREHVDRLDQRCRWLTERIKAKEVVGWDTVYDRSERDALTWALPHLRQLLEEA